MADKFWSSGIETNSGVQIFFFIVNNLESKKKNRFEFQNLSHKLHLFSLSLSWFPGHYLKMLNNVIEGHIYSFSTFKCVKMQRCWLKDDKVKLNKSINLLYWNEDISSYSIKDISKNKNKNIINQIKVAREYYSNKSFWGKKHYKI